MSEFPKGRRTCRECQNEMSRNYKRTHKEHIKEYNKIYKKNHVDAIKVYNHRYNIENRTKIQTRQNKQHTERRKIDINYKISSSLRSRLVKILKGGKHAHTFDLLGCSLDFLKKWFAFNFDDKMTFENYGKYWHIDHVIPCARFEIKNKDEEKCFHWTNMRPLFGKENIEKNDTLTKEIIDMQQKNIKRFLKKYKEDLGETTMLTYDKYAYLDV